MTDPTITPPDVSYANCYSLDGLYLVFAHITSPYITIYAISSGVYKTYSLDNRRDGKTILSMGYAKESGVAGETKKVVYISSI
jgi:hypothetical protein